MNGKIKLAALALVLSTLAASGFYWAWNTGDRPLQLPGTVETQEVRLSSRMGGRIKQVGVREGDLVQPGQVLVRLEMPELEAQREQTVAKLYAAEALLEKVRNGARSEERESAQAALQAAEARVQRLKAGFRVEEIEQAKHELDMWTAELVRAQQELEREKSLYPHSTSKAQLDLANANQRRLQGQVQATQARLKLLQAGSRVEDIAEFAAEAARMRANYQLLEAGSRSEDIREAEARVAELQGKLRELDANLKELVVVAPEPAVVEVLPVRPGDVVAPNQPVARVLRADDLWVKAYVSEVDLGKIRLNQAVELTVDAYPQKRFQGVIAHIAAVSEFTPRNVQSVDERRHQVFGIKVRVADPQGVFKSGMAATVYVPVH
ncbi:MAG: efflux RND transporter periplasmic adaptor subunit [Planctomycetia bacterium]|nr:efflux RND transporter periplasmic adaptor subunit [Planctomycetia bacterium]